MRIKMSQRRVEYRHDGTVFDPAAHKKFRAKPRILDSFAEDTRALFTGKRGLRGFLALGVLALVALALLFAYARWAWETPLWK